VPYIRKCILCYDRLLAGRQPACTEACPTKATIFGDRDDLLAEAHRRIREKPELYINHVWGENEVGGSSVLYISNVDLSFLAGGESLGATPLPSTTAKAMDAVPFAFCSVMGLMAGITWIVDRRMNKKEDEPDE